MATQNIAAWLTGPKVKPFKVDSAPMPIAGPLDVIIQNHAVAANPADWIIQNEGVILRDEQYPAILGFDLAGEIVSVGSEVKDFALGDRVCGVAFSDFSQKNSAFQLYTQSKTELLAKIPDHKIFKDSCILPLTMCTATAALFEADGLALPYPKVEPVKTGKIILIWSGSSSVGSCAIQAAIAAGFDVATTASSHNLEYCKSLGAKWAFDYKKDGVDDEIVETLKGYECVGVLDAWSRGTLARCANVILRLQGRKRLQTVFHKGLPLGEEIPDCVEVGYTYSINIAKSDVGPAVWRHWIPEALAVETLQCKPTAKVVGKGLESIQISCDMGFAGEVSASKLVIELV